MRIDFRRNLALKFFSAVLALLVWILTTGENQKIKDLLVPLQYTHLPDGMAISGDAPDKVSLRIQAPEPILQRITEDQVDGSLDLSQIQPGDQYLTLSPDRFHVPGATVIRVEPRVLPLRIVRQAQKEVPVVPRIEGKPPEGYEVVDYAVVPATVVVVGPEDAVRDVRRAATGSIAVDGLTATREFRVHPIPEADESGRVRIRDADRQVTVRIGIREKPLRRLFRSVPVHVRGEALAVRMKPGLVDVRVSGPASLVKALDRGNLLVEVTVEKLVPREREYRLVPRVSLLGLSPEVSRGLQAESAASSITVWVSPRSSEKP
jgi:YbbR domain-containing protein